MERDGMVVAVCYSSRISAEAAEAGVETVESFRGRGLALEAVRAWAAAIQDSGRLAFYSTEWTNKASRRIAEKLGAHEFGEDWHLT
jgi:RimJ/RimL family protein N-acetyltransferase